MLLEGTGADGYVGTVVVEREADGGDVGDGGGDDPTGPTSPQPARHWPSLATWLPALLDGSALWPRGTPRRAAHRPGARGSARR